MRIGGAVFNVNVSQAIGYDISVQRCTFSDVKSHL